MDNMDFRIYSFSWDLSRTRDLPSVHMCERGQGWAKIKKSSPLTSNREHGHAARPSQKPGTLPGMGRAFSTITARGLEWVPNGRTHFFIRFSERSWKNFILGSKES